jgi:hypothetical protein
VGATKADNNFVVRIYEKGRPIGPATYSIAIETVFDGRLRGYLRLLDRLMALAESDVTEGIIVLPSEEPA